MKKLVWLAGILALIAGLCSCNSKEGGGAQGEKHEQKVASAADRDLALKFLQGVQAGDKKKMYDAANLTDQIVAVSREKLIYSKKNVLSERQRREFEHALRISGQVDFFMAKMRRMFPNSSRFEILQAAAQSAADDVVRSEHRVKVIYLNRDEAMRDRTGKSVKEMIVYLQQLTLPVNGRPLHGFSFSSKDFEKFADKDFEVLSYF